MGILILTFFACVWIGGVCWILGAIQRKFQRSNNKYKQSKMDKNKELL